MSPQGLRLKMAPRSMPPNPGPWLRTSIRGEAYINTMAAPWLANALTTAGLPCKSQWSLIGYTKKLLQDRQSPWEWTWSLSTVGSTRTEIQKAVLEGSCHSGIPLTSSTGSSSARFGGRQTSKEQSHSWTPYSKPWLFNAASIKLTTLYILFEYRSSSNIGITY